jgi:NADH dehydrogenase
MIDGGGISGINAARALRNAPVNVTIFDRRNYHVFQPMLYQVATAALSPADISSPIRTILRSQSNCEVVLAPVTRVDLSRRRLYLHGGSVQYDYLILAAGATHAYFGHDEWAAIAPGLKTIEDATEMRRRILLAFEAAEYEGSASARVAALTFGIVGAGPTGVELAGAIKEIAGQTIPEDYRHIDTRTTRVILFEGGPRVLSTFSPELSTKAQRVLERMGVEVRLNSVVTGVDSSGIRVGSEFIPVRNVFWAAGVRASSLGATLGVPLDRAGRVIVSSDLSVPGHPEVFVVGDMAAAVSAKNGAPVPGVAQGGIQMGRFAGEVIAREAARGSVHDAARAVAHDAARGVPAPSPGAPTRPAFSYWDKGSMAVIGKAKAVAQIGPAEFGGFFAWLLWGGIHIAFLIGFRHRFQVLFNWFWSWLLDARDARLITGDAELVIESPSPAGFSTEDAEVPE